MTTNSNNKSQSTNLAPLAERYTLIIPRFGDGLRKLVLSSDVMAEVFENLMEDLEQPSTNKPADWLAEDAQMELLLSIQIPETRLEYMGFPQMLLYWDNEGCSYLTKDNIPVHWRKLYPGDEDSEWMFWVLAPTGYVEPGAKGELGAKLQAMGFIHEHLEDAMPRLTKEDYLDIKHVLGYDTDIYED